MGDTADESRRGVAPILVSFNAARRRWLQLGDQPITIGRDPASVFTIDSPHVSRTHALVEPDGAGGWLLTSLSKNGTILNGRVCRSCSPIELFDEFQIEDTTFQLLPGDPASRDAGPATIQPLEHPATAKAGPENPSTATLNKPPEAAVVSTASNRFSSTEDGETQREEPAPAHPAAPPLPSAMDFLFKLYALTEKADLRALLRSTLEAACSTCRARGFVIYQQDRLFRVFPHLAAGKAIAEGFSSTVVNDVHKTGKAVWREFARSDRRETTPYVDIETGERISPSAENLGLRSVLALPVTLTGRVVAVLYLDSQDARAFSDGLVALLERLATSMAQPLKMLIDDARTRETGNRSDDQGGIVGEHPLLRAVLAHARRAAETSVGVMLRGESGTGKTSLARFIHSKGARAKAPFVSLNCAALPESLLEAELFGTVPGAFTEATNRIGLVRVADGGTLFLDEVGDMPPRMQGTLLQFIETGTFRRLGSSKEEKVDVRVITGTNKNLEEMVSKGTFRQDLYFRLNVVPLVLPPLRARRSDIPALARHILAAIAKKHGRDVVSIDNDAMDALLRRDYPGNIRELENTLERAVVLGHGSTITLSDIEGGLAHDPDPRPESGSVTTVTTGTRGSGERCLEEFRRAKNWKAYEKQLEADPKREFFRSALAEVGFDVNVLAKTLGLHHGALFKKLKACGIDIKDLRKRSREISDTRPSGD